MTRGIFITLEGVEGGGKSTAIECVHNVLLQYGVNAIVTREPGGTEISEKIRHLLLEHHNEHMASDTELLLMFAARAQHIAQVIEPNLSHGHWVVCDRFTDASYAYQGGGRGIAEARIKVLENWVHEHVQPNYVLLLDAPVDVALSRIRHRKKSDRIEEEQHSFFERVRNAYLKRAERDPKRYCIIDASVALDKVEAQLKNQLRKIIEVHNEAGIT